MNDNLDSMETIGLTRNVGLFRPPFLYCPGCNSDQNNLRGEGWKTVKRLGDTSFNCRNCGKDFELIESLMSGGVHTSGILNAFSAWSFSAAIKVEAGKFIEFSLPLPEGMKIFAISVGGMRLPEDPRTNFIPSLLESTNGNLIIGTSASSATDNADLGSRVTVTIFANAYASQERASWEHLLYDALGDLSENRAGMSLFKVATAMEMAMESCIERYLENHELDSRLMAQFLKSFRGISEKARALGQIVEAKLEPTMKPFLDSALVELKRTIADPRNKFAHSNSDEIDHKVAGTAMRTAIPLFWVIDALRNDLAKKVETNR